jgi:uncharacterized protein
MYFVIVAKDVPGAETQERRLAARPEHMDGLRRLRMEDRMIDGGAILDDAGRLVGSVLLCEFPDRAALDAYLAEEPFARERVWQDVSVYPIRRVDWDALLRSAPAS